MHTDISPNRTQLNDALGRACQIAGGQKALATAIGRKQGTVWEWLFVNGNVPPDVAMKIEDVTGVPAEAMNPHLAAFAKRRGVRVRRLKAAA